MKAGEWRQLGKGRNAWKSRASMHSKQYETRLKQAGA